MQRHLSQSLESRLEVAPRDLEEIREAFVDLTAYPDKGGLPNQCPLDLWFSDNFQ
jgi:hypothetical protein